MKLPTEKELQKRDRLTEQLKYRLIDEAHKIRETKVPIYRGCQNRVCFCTGKCQEIIGYRDSLPNEEYPLY